MIQIIKKRIKDTFIPNERNNYKPRALRNKALSIYSIIIITIKISTIILTALLPSIAELSTISADEIISFTNQKRNEQGLNILSANSTLASAADMKAHDMFDDSYFAHTAPDGKSDWWFFKQAGYNYDYAGANLAMDFDTSQTVVDAWMDSPSHRANILNSDYKDIGIAVVSGNFQGRETVIVVQYFGSQQSPPPAPAPAPEPEQPSTPPEETPPTETPSPEETPIPSPKPEPTSKPTTPEDTTPPSSPNITQPADNSIFNKNTIEINGNSEVNSSVSIFDHNGKINTTTANSEGQFSITLKNLPEGTHSFSATAKDAAANVSDRSKAIKVEIDTKAPIIDKKSYATPSVISSQMLDIVAYVQGNPENVKASIRNEIIDLSLSEDKYIGTIKKQDDNPNSIIEIKIMAKDKAGNSAEETIITLPKETPKSPVTTTAGTAIVGGAEGIIGNISTDKRVIDIAEKVLVVIIIILLILLLINIFVKIKKQHPKTIVLTIFVITLAGVMLLI